MWQRAVRALRRPELQLLLLALVAAGALWTFGALADEIGEGSTRQLDRRVLLVLREAGDLSDPLGPEWVVTVARDVTALGGWTVLGMLTAGVLGFLLLAGARGMAALVGAAVAGGWITSNLLKVLFERTRPDIVPHLTEVSTASFPSGHALLSAVVYLTLGALLASVLPRRRLRLYVIGTAIALSAVVGFSRVFLGVHYPSDVVAGWTVGVAWASACWIVARFLQRRGHVESEVEVTPADDGAGGR